MYVFIVPTLRQKVNTQANNLTPTTYTKTMKIVFAGGGTAGHVTPNIALINMLEEDMYYIGTDGIERILIQPLIDSGKIREYCTINAYKLRRNMSLSHLLLPFRLIKSVRQARTHLRRLQPDVVFSKGGYVGLPVVLAAHKLGIPTVIHESDLSVGLANKIASHFASRYLSAFPCDKHAEVTGVIIRQELLHGDRARGLAAMGFDGNRPILLVTGGSLGAVALNEAVCACPKLAERFDIFMLTGKGKSTGCRHVHEAEYSDAMADLLAAADVCLTRAGSTTLAELTLCGVPFVAVPLTHGSRGEQRQNAAWFASRGCGFTLDEEHIAGLYTAICAAYDNRNAIWTHQRAQKNLYGTERAAEILLSYSPNHRRY